MTATPGVTVVAQTATALGVQRTKKKVPRPIKRKDQCRVNNLLLLFFLV